MHTYYTILYILYYIHYTILYKLYYTIYTILYYIYYTIYSTISSRVYSSSILYHVYSILYIVEYIAVVYHLYHLQGPHSHFSRRS